MTTHSTLPLTTARLAVRRFTPEDGEALYAYLSDAETVRYEPYEPYARDAALREATRRATDERFYAVCLRSGELVGNLTLTPGDFGEWELGYVFSRARWGRGYATESARALVTYAFDALGARRVTAMCDPRNERSWRLLERLGLRREGRLVENIYFRTDESGRPIWQDTLLYGVLKREWGRDL